MVKRLSLRARLLLGVVALAAVGLVAANVATYSTLSSYLLDRTDSTLDQTAQTLRRPGPGGGIRSAPPGTFVQVRSLDGDTVVATFSGATLPGASVPAPNLPDAVKPPAPNRTTEAVRYFTVGGAHGGPEYRVRASIAQGDEAMLLVASSLRDVNSTLHRLLAIELVVTALVLAAIAGLGLWLVRLGLRPLDAIGQTASAIAAGDLSRRVERAEERTEVGRLGLALNAMLARIESSFRAQEASERKLRRFVADASHELRTPLSAVRAYAELYDRGAAERPDDLERSMKGISRESERMSVLVEDLLLLARLDDGRPLEREPVELDEVVGEAVETAQAVDPDRAIELHAEPATVLGDRVRLAPDRRQPPRERPRPHASGHARFRLGQAPKRERRDRGHGRGAGARRGAPRASLRALLPRRPVPRPGERRRRTRPRDRRRRRRGARRDRLGIVAAGRGHDRRDRASARPRRGLSSTADSQAAHRGCRGPGGAMRETPSAKGHA